MTTRRGQSSRRAITDEDKARKRREILDAAKAVFAERGYHATTVAEVARAAGLSYGLIYWYFESKDALFDALMEHEERQLRRAIEAALDDVGRQDRLASLRDAVRAAFEFFESDRAAAKLLFRDSYALGDRFERHLFGIYERFIDDMEALVADGQRRGLIVEAPPRMIAFAMAALIAQLAQRRLMTDDGLHAAVMADFVVTMLFDGLRPRRDIDAAG